MRPVVKQKNFLGFKIWLEKLGYEVKQLDGGFVARAKVEKHNEHIKSHIIMCVLAQTFQVIKQLMSLGLNLKTIFVHLNRLVQQKQKRKFCILLKVNHMEWVIWWLEIMLVVNGFVFINFELWWL
jgi:hypothetical protein